MKRLGTSVASGLPGLATPEGVAKTVYGSQGRRGEFGADAEAGGGGMRAGRRLHQSGLEVLAKPGQLLWCHVLPQACKDDCFLVLD
ncbi:MAG: hypothetical protein ACYC1D_19855, partial [Acidimicrobiales bacterium]